MIELFYQIVLVLFVAVSVLLFCFGMNCYVIIAFFLRRARSTSERQLLETKKWQAEIQDADLPIVTTQIPLYNECNVAERVIRSVAAMDYPAEKHQIQVLDDSNDETADFVDRTAASLRSQGIWIDVFRRPKRRGYKAGALDDAIPKVAGDFIAIFDSDFTPPSDFLRRMLPHFREPQTGIVQARWDHLNQDHSSLTRAQAVGIDGHFLIEQVARSANRLLLNFNGTAGIWRKEAIVDAGGWSADTLTEDLDLSYRAQLKGWHIEYVPDVAVPAELPESYTAFKSQQFRWAKGSIQTAIKLWPKVMVSKLPWVVKWQSSFHLSHYLTHPLMLVLALLAYPVLGERDVEMTSLWFLVLLGPVLLATAGPSLLYAVSQRRLYPGSWVRRVLRLPILTLIGFGICLSNTKAVGEAILGIRSGFTRTPKSGAKTIKPYASRVDFLPLLELIAGIYTLFSAGLFFELGNYIMAPFLLIYGLGFCWMGGNSLREHLLQRRERLTMKREAVVTA